jgi:hypothetical protein
MRKFRNIVMMFALILAVSLCISCGDGGSSMPGNKPRTPTPSQNQTALGIKYQSAAVVTDAQKAEMDKALTQLFAEARARNYAQKLNHSDYSLIIRNDCVEKGGIKVWLERLDQYDGTEYDQDPTVGVGMIYQPERVVLNPTRPPVFTICYDTPETMGLTTRYGAEHIILYYNDQSEYQRTAVHGPPHPIIQ